jgi:hypothetical protein
MDPDDQIEVTLKDELSEDRSGTPIAETLGLSSERRYAVMTKAQKRVYHNVKRRKVA